MRCDGAVSWANRIVAANADGALTIANKGAGAFSATSKIFNDRVESSFTTEALDPAIALPWFPQAKKLQGSLEVQGTIAGTFKNPLIGMQFSFDHPVANGLVLTSTGNLSFADGIATASIKAVQKGVTAPLIINAHIPLALHELSKGLAAVHDGAMITVSGDAVSYKSVVNAFAPYVQSSGTFNLQGTLSKNNDQWRLSCSTHVDCQGLSMKGQDLKAGHAVFDLHINGPIARPTGGFSLSGGPIEYKGNLITACSGKGSIAGDAINIDTLHLSVGSGNADLSAKVPLTLKNGISLNKAYHISATVAALPLALMQPFMPEAVSITKGELSGQVEVNGRAEGPPMAKGTLQFRNGQGYIYECDKPVGPVSADLVIENDSLILRELDGKCGGGRITGSGWATLDSTGISRSACKFQLRDVRLSECYDNLDIGIQGADITLTKDSLTALKMDALLAATHFTQDYSLIELGERIKRKPLQAPRPPNHLFDKVVMSLTVNLNSNLNFDSNLGKMLFDGNVTIAGRPDNPSIAGQIRIVNGFVYYLDRKFTVTQGTISQHDPRLLNPSLDLTANANVSWYPPQGGRTDYDITLLIKGDLSTPVITLSAVPSLAQPQIISLLTFGTIQTGLGNDVGSRTGSLVGEQLMGLGTRKLARFLNVESVDINGNIFNPSSVNPQVADIYGNASGPTSEGPQLSVTKQVSSRAAVTYTTGLTNVNQQSVLVSYRLLPFLYLEAETDQQAQGGIDLKFRYSH
jgi:autotransporter translocation and assembly factor TamB